MIIDDLIILGRAVPEPIKDGRITICLGGYSPTHGFIRIYPTKANMNINRWAIISVEVEKDKRDTRKESWKITGSKENWDYLQHCINKVGNWPKKQRLPLIYSLATDCISTINQNRNSLGIIKPNIIRTYFRNNPKFGQAYQPLFPSLQENTMVKRDFLYEPRIEYRCSSNCQTKGPHDQQVLEWGFFKWFEKHPNRHEQVWENAMLDRQDYTTYFFVGNQARYRTSYLIISILRFKKQPIQEAIIF